MQVGTHLVERYSKRSNQWVEKAPLANQRFAFGAAFIDEGAYALGGHVFCNDTASEDCGNRYDLSCAFMDHIKRVPLCAALETDAWAPISAVRVVDRQASTGCSIRWRSSTTATIRMSSSTSSKRGPLSLELLQTPARSSYSQRHLQ